MIPELFFFAKKFEWTVNIKINLFTSFERWYGLQITKQVFSQYDSLWC
jgi:hypothetical protein